MNGLKIQWGKQLDKSAGRKFVPFTLNFTTAPFVSTAVIESDTSSNTLYVNYLSSWTFIDSISASGFYCGVSGLSKKQMSWIAIGY